jgi:hypothetical protein
MIAITPKDWELIIRALQEKQHREVEISLDLGIKPNREAGRLVNKLKFNLTPDYQERG